MVAQVCKESHLKHVERERGRRRGSLSPSTSTREPTAFPSKVVIAHFLCWEHEPDRHLTHEFSCQRTGIASGHLDDSVECDRATFLVYGSKNGRQRK